jgi:hypothetical protein
MERTTHGDCHSGESPDINIACSRYWIELRPSERGTQTERERERERERETGRQTSSWVAGGPTVLSTNSHQTLVAYCQIVYFASRYFRLLVSRRCEWVAARLSNIIDLDSRLELHKTRRTGSGRVSDGRSLSGGSVRFWPVFDIMCHRPNCLTKDMWKRCDNTDNVLMAFVHCDHCHIGNQTLLPIADRRPYSLSHTGIWQSKETWLRTIAIFRIFYLQFVRVTQGATLSMAMYNSYAVSV